VTDAAGHGVVEWVGEPIATRLPPPQVLEWAVDRISALPTFISLPPQ
jgi:hypothetical protein